MLRYRRATESDGDAVKSLLIEHFHPFEPLLLGWITEGDVSIEDSDSTVELIGDGLCIVAEDPETNQIVGAAINSISRPDDVQEMRKEAERTENFKWAECLTFFADHEEEIDFFGKFSVDEVFQIHMLVVDQDYRGKSIGLNLVSKSLDVARNVKFSIVHCSSLFSQKIAEKLEMKLIYEKLYEDCSGKNGQRLVEARPPHDRIKTFIKEL